MRNLAERIEENGVVEEDDGSWGSLVVLYDKTPQENEPWYKYQWRMCVSYQ